MLPASYRWPTPEVLSQLVRHAQGNDAGGVDALLAAIRPALLAFFRQRTDSDVAEDLSQMTLVRVGRAIARIDPERADSYLSAVARNLLRTSYRIRARERQRTTALDATIEVGTEHRADSRAEYAELVTAVHRACLDIPYPALREVALGVLRGYSAAELADRLEISPITVRTRLMRVRAILRHELHAYLVDASEPPNVIASPAGRRKAGMRAV